MTPDGARALPSDTEILDTLLFDDRLDLRHRREDGTWTASDLESGKVVAQERDPRKAIAVFMLRSTKRPCSLSYPTKMTCECRRTPDPATQRVLEAAKAYREYQRQRADWSEKSSPVIREFDEAVEALAAREAGR